MTASFTLARIAGIKIGVNWTWLIVFALITWSLATQVFPDQNPGLSDGTYVVIALVAALLFFLSILLHELGHAIQARRDGMEIEGITLWLFGGVAQFKGAFPSAGAEFRIAIAGPLVSLALGIFFVLVAVGLSMPQEVDGVAAWLGYINLLLLVFNLLPALPLDGGRVLRSALWKLRGDFGWATRVSATIGRGFGYLFIAGGVAMFFWMDAVGGLWLAFIGWFLLGAATSESRYLAVRDALDGLRVRDLMVPNPLTVTPDLTLEDLYDRVISSHRYTTYPVVEDGHVVGLLPFRCIAQVPRSEWRSRRVRDCMLPLDEVPKLRADDAAAEALAELDDGVGRGLVLEDGDRLAGLVSITDVMRALEVGALRRRTLQRQR